MDLNFQCFMCPRECRNKREREREREGERENVMKVREGEKGRARESPSQT